MLFKILFIFSFLSLGAGFSHKGPFELCKEEWRYYCYSEDMSCWNCKPKKECWGLYEECIKKGDAQCEMDWGHLKKLTSESS